MKAITLTIVTHKAHSLNYGETIGNISTLKKLTQNTGHPKSLITYFSDKAIKYDVKRIGRESFGWHLMDQSVVAVFKGCVENNNFNYSKFYEDMVKNFEEFDLFGGMFADIEEIGGKKDKNGYYKVDGNKVKIETERLKRTQPVRFTNGYSISEFSYDTNLLNDIDAYNRYIQYTAGQKEQSLVFPEEHYSYYTYTLNIDLDQIGAVEIEETDNSGKIVKSWKRVITLDEKKKRIKSLLEIVLLWLHRKIKGRVENLTPVFVIGGVYDVKQPFFHNAIRFYEKDNNLIVEGKDIEKIFNTYEIKEKTYIHHCNQVEIKDDRKLFESSNVKANLKEFLDTILKEIYLFIIKEIVFYLSKKEFDAEKIKECSLEEIEKISDSLSENEKIFEIERKIEKLSKEADGIKSNLKEKIKSIYNKNVKNKLNELKGKLNLTNEDSNKKIKPILDLIPEGSMVEIQQVEEEKIKILEKKDLILLKEIFEDISRNEDIVNTNEKDLVKKAIDLINKKNN